MDTIGAALEVRKQRARYAGLMAKVRQIADRNMNGYRRRVRLLLAFGAAYTVVLSLFLIGVVAFAAWALTLRGSIGVLMILAIAIYVLLNILQAFLRRSPPPVGCDLRREDAPKLWAMVDEVAAAVDAPAMDRILIDKQLNAAASQVATFGFWGRTRNILVLGYPLLLALDSQQLRGVVAHEMGHFSRRHGAIMAKLHRMSASWDRVAHRVQLRAWLTNLLFLKFLKWYLPLLDAYSFELARRSEYEADAYEAQLNGEDGFVSVTVRMAVSIKRMTEASTVARIKAIEEGVVPETWSATYLPALQESVSASEAETIVQAALAEEPLDFDTHPTMKQRIANVSPGLLEGIREPFSDWVERMAQPPTISAAEAYLGSTPPEPLLEYLQNVNQEYVESWSQYQEEVSQAKMRFEESQSASEKAKWLVKFSSYYDPSLDEQPLELCRLALTIDPDCESAQYYLAYLLIERDSIESKRLLLQVASRGGAYADAARQLLLEHNHKEEDISAIRQLAELEQKNKTVKKKVRRELNLLRTADRVKPTRRTSEEQKLMVEYLSEHSIVDQAHLVDIALDATNGETVQLLVISAKLSWQEKSMWHTNRFEFEDYLRSLFVDFPFTCPPEAQHVEVVVGSGTRVTRRAKSMPDAKVYP